MGQWVQGHFFLLGSSKLSTHSEPCFEKNPLVSEEPNGSAVAPPLPHITHKHNYFYRTPETSKHTHTHIHTNKQIH
jgi:hypothetical protein